MHGPDGKKPWIGRSHGQSGGGLSPTASNFSFSLSMMQPLESLLVRARFRLQHVPCAKEEELWSTFLAAVLKRLEMDAIAGC